MTRSQMETSWEKNFPVVNPLPINLKGPGEFTWIRDQQGRLVMKEIPESGYIVPFLKSLEQQLSVKSTYDNVLENFASNKKKLFDGSDDASSSKAISDFWDGSFVQNHPVYIKHNGEVLVIQMYYDEVEPVNVLGSNKGKHKVGVFYTTLLNIQPENRSNLRAINLLGIINSNLLRKHGAKPFLQPFVDDLVKLQSGVQLNVRGDKRI